MKITNSKILVSVVIPVYNSERFISEAIESVLNQSLKEIELILVDDGSTDKSLMICEQFSQMNERVRLLEQKNSGVSNARNNGLKLANGEYIFFMDSDDTIDSEFLSTSYELAKKQDLDIVVIGEDCCKRLPNVYALPTMAQLLKHDFLLKHSDIRFPENIQPCEDGLFSHQLLALTTRVAGNPSGQYHYRYHENQNHKSINNAVGKVLAQIPRWFEILDDFYKKNNLYNSHSLHLALFMEHEPFQLRYLSMPLDADQKKYLHKLIKEFTQKNVLPFLKEEDKRKLNAYFLFFINSPSHVDFENYYKRLKLKCKVKLFFVKVIPISKVRKRMRKEIRSKIY